MKDGPTLGTVFEDGKKLLMRMNRKNWNAARTEPKMVAFPPAKAETQK
jgi:hypothetical protein